MARIIKEGENLTLAELDWNLGEKFAFTSTLNKTGYFYFLGKIGLFTPTSENNRRGFILRFSEDEEDYSLFVHERPMISFKEPFNSEKPKKGIEMYTILEKKISPIDVNRMYTGSEAERFIKENSTLREYAEWSKESGVWNCLKRRLFPTRNEVYHLIGNNRK